MALVLAMQEGRSFFVGDTEVLVERVFTPHRVQVKVVGQHMDSMFELSTSNRAEILPNVFAQVGLDPSHSMVKIAIEAPKSMKILRDALYHEAKAK